MQITPTHPHKSPVRVSIRTIGHMSDRSDKVTSDLIHHSLAHMSTIPDISRVTAHNVSISGQ